MINISVSELLENHGTNSKIFLSYCPNTQLTIDCQLTV